MTDSTPTTRGFDAWDSLSFQDYLDIARRRRWYIIPTLGGIFLTALIVAFMLPSIYRADTVILVDPQKVPTSFVASIESGNIAERLSLIRVEVLSPSRLKKLIDTMGLYPELRSKMGEQDLIALMQKRISVDFVEQGGVRLNAFRIGFLSRNPLTSAQVANQLASMFIEENLKAREQLSYGTSEFLDGELQRTKRDMEQKEAALSALKRRNFMDLPESKQYHVEALDSLRGQLRSSQDKINGAQQEKLYLQSMMVTAAPTIDLDGESNASPDQQQIGRLQSRLADLQGRYGPSHPDVQKVMAELNELRSRSSHSDVVKHPMAAPHRKASGRNPVLEAQLRRLDEQIDQETRRQKPLEDQIAFHVSKLQEEPLFEQKMAALERDYETLKLHYTGMLNKKLSADTSTDLETRQKGEKFVILEPALPPEKPYGSIRLVIILGGLIAGVLAGCALAFIVDLMDESVRNEREAAQLIGHPVFATIPRILSDIEVRKRRMHSIVISAATASASVAVAFVISFFTTRLLY